MSNTPESALFDLAANHGLTTAQLLDFLRSEPLSHALRLFTDRLKSAKANHNQGIITVVSAVEFRAYPSTGEDGNKYVAYRCPLCGTRAHVYPLKRVRGPRTEEPENRQLPILGCEVKP